MRLIILVVCIASVSYCRAEENLKQEPHFKSVDRDKRISLDDLETLSHMALAYSIAHHLDPLKYNLFAEPTKRVDCIDCKDALIYIYNRGHWLPFRRRNKCPVLLRGNPDDKSIGPFVDPIVYH